MDMKPSGMTSEQFHVEEVSPSYWRVTPANGPVNLLDSETELSRTYDVRKAELHVTAANARRVVDTALTLTAQPPLLPDDTFAQDLDAEVFRVPNLGSAWQSALRGLDTRSDPGKPRPITFDDKAARGRHKELVHIHPRAKVTEALQARRDSDVTRAREIFAAFRINLRESRDRLTAEIRNQEEALSRMISRRNGGVTYGRWRIGWRAWTSRSSGKSPRFASGTATSNRTCPQRPWCSR